MKPDKRETYRGVDSPPLLASDSEGEPDPAAVTELAAEALLLVELRRRTDAAPALSRRVAINTNRLTPVERRVLLACLTARPLRRSANERPN
jgi:hypothetical protein